MTSSLSSLPSGRISTYLLDDAAPMTPRALDGVAPKLKLRGEATGAVSGLGQ